MLLTTEHHNARNADSWTLRLELLNCHCISNENILIGGFILVKHKLPGVCRDKSLLVMLHRCVFPSQCVSVILRLNMRCWTMYESMLVCEWVVQSTSVFLSLRLSYYTHMYMSVFYPAQVRKCVSECERPETCLPAFAPLTTMSFVFSNMSNCRHL